MFSDHQASATSWCAEEFANVDLKDERLNRRCQELAADLAAQPTMPINQACEDWADTKAAYRFFDHAQVTLDSILAPHQQRTVERMSQHPVVLTVQDTSFLNYTHHPKTKGVGAIGTKQQKQRGFGLHSTLALTTTGLPLGVLTQEIWARPLGQPSKTPAECGRQPIEEKESYKWIKAFRQTLALAPTGVRTLTVCDREADIYEMFELADQEEAGLLVRARFNRALVDEFLGKLWAKVEQSAIAGQLRVHVPKSDKQPERDAVVSIRFTNVTLRPPWRPEQKKLPPVTLNAVLVREETPSAAVEEPIEWLLLTNWPVDNFEDAAQIVKWYRCRWQIEVFHKVLKSGCSIEECRLQTSERLFPFIALKSVIAWRLHWMTYVNRHEPATPCTVVLAEHEWQALYMRIHRTTALPDTPPTVREAVRWIGKLGGFLGRKRDGEPGITVIWRGWQRLHDLADTWYLVKEQTYG